MILKERLESDLKTALLSHNTLEVNTLRGLKSAILYAEVAGTSRGVGLTDPEIIAVFTKEAKKRQESADIYLKANQPERAEQELTEKAIIERYLPAQLSEAEINNLIDEVIANIQNFEPILMGKVIAEVKEKSQGAADGGTIARLVKERLPK